MLETIDFTELVALLHMNKANFIPSDQKRTGNRQRGLISCSICTTFNIYLKGTSSTFKIGSVSSGSLDLMSWLMTL